MDWHKYYSKQIARLEAELANVTFERDMYKEFVNDRIKREPANPRPIISDEELEAMMNGPPGIPFDDIIKEFEDRLDDENRGNR